MLLRFGQVIVQVDLSDGGAGTGSFAAAADRVGVLIDQQLSGDRRVLAGKNKPRRIRVLDEIVCFRLYSDTA